MSQEPPPANELERLSSLRDMSLLDTPAEERFDRLTRLAKRLFRAPFSMITLIDEERQWFKSAQGHNMTETPLEGAICRYTILSDEPMVVPDASIDPRLFDTSFVRGEPFVRFYAGVPIRNQDGQRVGTICVLDIKERQVEGDEMAALQDLAACVEAECRLIRFTESEQDLLQELDDLHGADYGTRLRGALQSWASFGRYVGDKFLLIGRHRPDEVESRAAQIQAHLTQSPTTCAPRKVPRINVGVALWRGVRQNRQDWLERAEKALRGCSPERPVTVAV